MGCGSSSPLPEAQPAPPPPKTTPPVVVVVEQQQQPKAAQERVPEPTPVAAPPPPAIQPSAPAPALSAAPAVAAAKSAPVSSTSDPAPAAPAPAPESAGVLQEPVFTDPVGPSTAVAPPQPVQPEPAAAEAAVPLPGVEAAEEIITGVLWKKGEAGTAGANHWKQRYIVISPHTLCYFISQAAYEQGKDPIRKKRVDLRHFGVVKGLAPPQGTALLAAITDGSLAASRASTDEAAQAAFFLEPRPGTEETRRWEFRAIELADVDGWLDVFAEFGCVREEALLEELRGPAKPSSQ